MAAGSAKAARILVAEAALKKLDSLDPDELRALCNCPKSEEEVDESEE
jgi:hypothetical protein